MKCPNCHHEVERGSLFCPNCLTEIPWVKEFDTVETQLEKKKQTAAQIRNQGKVRHLEKEPRGNKKIMLILGAVFALLFGLFCYRQLHTFSALYTRAEKYYEKGKYEKAGTAIEKALEKEPRNLSANLLFARVLKKKGDDMSALLILKPMVKEYPDSVEAATLYVKALAAEHRMGELRKFLKSCKNQEILKACSDFICSKPEVSLKAGVYTEPQLVELLADYDKIYYTLDGSMPNQSSTLYAGPIAIGEGTTVLKAFGINKKNISSELLTAEYVVVLQCPEEPEITPKEGSYNKKTTIKISVPDGCTAYYSFDDPNLTTFSAQYQAPVNLPQGYHTFYAFLVGPNGEESPVSKREYYLEY